jgi:hypothetical protein
MITADSTIVQDWIEIFGIGVTKAGTELSHKHCTSTAEVQLLWKGGKKSRNEAAISPLHSEHYLVLHAVCPGRTKGLRPPPIQREAVQLDGIPFETAHLSRHDPSVINQLI